MVLGICHSNDWISVLTFASTEPSRAMKQPRDSTRSPSKSAVLVLPRWGKHVCSCAHDRVQRSVCMFFYFSDHIFNQTAIANRRCHNWRCWCKHWTCNNRIGPPRSAIMWSRVGHSLFYSHWQSSSKHSHTQGVKRHGKTRKPEHGGVTSETGGKEERAWLIRVKKVKNMGPKGIGRILFQWRSRWN